METRATATTLTGWSPARAPSSGAGGCTPGGKPNLIGENPSKFSYLNYAKRTQDLWSGFNKPSIIGECGYDHTYYEPGMPGYLEMYHNALWASLVNGLSATPFLKVSDGDGWAMQGEGMTFGWVVNSLNGVANGTFSVPGLEDGDYDVHLFRTWCGEYMPPTAATATGGTLSVKVPELRPVGQRAQNIGNDVAFKIVKKGVAIRPL